MKNFFISLLQIPGYYYCVAIMVSFLLSWLLFIGTIKLVKKQLIMRKEDITVRKKSFLTIFRAISIIGIIPIALLLNNVFSRYLSSSTPEDAFDSHVRNIIFPNPQYTHFVVNGEHTAFIMGYPDEDISKLEVGIIAEKTADGNGIALWVEDELLT